MARLRKILAYRRKCPSGVRGCMFSLPGHPHKIGNRWVH